MDNIKKIEGAPLVNIVLAEVIAEGDNPDEALHFVFDTAQEATMEPTISEGEENFLRVKNKILALDKTEDITLGYDLTLSFNTLIPELFALIDGGELIKDEEGQITGYVGPMSGVPVSRRTFTLNLYTEEKDSDGETLNFYKFVFRNCKGKPVGFKLDDGDFFVPEMTITTRPKRCERPIEWYILDELPEYEEVEVCPVDLDTFSGNIKTNVKRIE